MIETRGLKVLGDVIPCGAGNRRAAAAYLSVLSGSGKKIYHNPEKLNKAIISRAHKHLNQPEFDVVKKRRIMDAVLDDTEDAGTCPKALERFEDFEANVLKALAEIDLDDKEFKNNEILQMEQDLCSGVQPTMGGVYVAVSKAVKYPKIGATRRSHPSARLAELSRYVPSPFELMFWVPTIVPFKTEAEIHRHFAALRIREKGACTEFFDVDVGVLGEYLRTEYHVQVDGV